MTTTVHEFLTVAGRAARMLEVMDAALLDVAKLASRHPDHPLAGEIVEAAFKARENCAAAAVARKLRMVG